MKFSIIIPAYKRRYLEECIDSVLAQTFEDFELVIVNDASPEDLDSVVAAFSDPRIRYYVNARNCGAVDVVDNWNIALGYAQGDYVICMGDDDRLLPSCLEEYTRMIEAYPDLDVYHAWTEIIDERSEVVDVQEPRPLRESVYSMMWWRWHGRQQYIGDFLFRTEALKQAGGFYKLPLAWGSDDLTAFRAAAQKGIANSQVPLFQYRSSALTISRTGNIRMKMKAVDGMEDWCKQFVSIPLSNDINTTVIARVLQASLRDYIPRAMAKQRVGIMAEGMRRGLLRWSVHFMLHRKLYRVNLKQIVYAGLVSLKERCK